jgi:hypothetical protein
MRFLCSSGLNEWIMGGCKEGVRRQGNSGRVALGQGRENLESMLNRQSRWLRLNGTNRTNGTNETGSNQIKEPNPMKSNQIKPNQTSCGGRKMSRNRTRRWARGQSSQWLVVSGWCCMPAIQPSQSQSNQSNQEGLEIMVKIRSRSSCPKVGAVSGRSNPVKPSQTREGGLG